MATDIDTFRLEAFSDGVMAVIITIMVLALKTPDGTGWHELRTVLAPLLVYALSFMIVGTYWNNHHHLLKATKRIGARVMWANLLFLFCISLIPFGASWLGSNPRNTIPTFTFGLILFACAMAYSLLQSTIVRAQRKNTKIVSALAEDYKGRLSGIGFALAVPVALIAPLVADIMFVGIVLVWFIPDRRLVS